MEKPVITLRRFLLQILFLLVLYSVCRVFFVWYNHRFFYLQDYSSVSSLFIHGLRFDLAAIAFTNFPFFIFSLLPGTLPHLLRTRKFMKFLFIVPNSLAVIISCADIAYYPFISKRMQFDAFRFIDGEKGNDFYRLMPTLLLEYWYLCLLCVLLIFLLIKVYKRIDSIQPQVTPSLKNLVTSTAVFIAGLGCCVVAMRGGLQLKPLNIISASEIVDARNMAAVINTPFSIIKTIGKKRLQPANYYPESELNNCYKGLHIPFPAGSAGKQNVVLFIVESLSSKYLGFFNGEAKTPFLDSLFSQSLVYSNGFANANETVQGIPAILSSIPSWQDEPFIFSPYALNSITSLASMLKKEGYQTSFFHGGFNGTMGFEPFCKLAGFDKYYGKKEYNNDADFDGDWGIWDEPFLQFQADKLINTGKPFFSTVLTLNTHHPFSIPGKYREQFNQKGDPILPCIQYTDFAIRRFFEKIKHTDWYKNTLFVFTADHAFQNTSKKDAHLSDYYRIPIVFHKPDGSLKGISPEIANQIDIMPSVLHLLNYPSPYFALGKNLFDESCNRFSISYNAGIYQYIDSAYCFQFNGQKAIALYKWKTDSLLRENLLKAQVSQVNYIQQEESLKKMIQSFNSCMINNKMIYQDSRKEGLTDRNTFTP